MNYQAFTSESLTMMYEGVRGALAVDDALKRKGQETWLLPAASRVFDQLAAGEPII